jgi:hypothetical protein
MQPCMLQLQQAFADRCSFPAEVRHSAGCRRAYDGSEPRRCDLAQGLDPMATYCPDWDQLREFRRVIVGSVRAADPAQSSVNRLGSGPIGSHR